MVGADSVRKEAFLKVLAGKLVISAGEFTPDIPNLKLAFLESNYTFKNLSGLNDFFYQQRFNATFSDDAPTVSDFLLDAIGDQSHSGYWDLDRVVDLLYLNFLKTKQLIKLSNGETKKLRLASLLIKNPRLLLLHDPMVGLDSATRTHFDEILQSIIDSGISVVMTVDPSEIPVLLTHIAVVKEKSIDCVSKNKYVSIGPSISSQPIKPTHQEILRDLIQRQTPEIFQIVVRMNQVNIRYGESVILKDIDFEVKQGERWALQGHNGAGKSTLLSLIYGDNPQAYAIDLTLFDRRKGTGESIWDIKQKIGYVSPEQLHYFRTSGDCRSVIKSGLRDGPYDTPTGPYSSDELTDKWLNLLEITHLANTPFKYASVMDQRLALLGRAFIKKPPLLILDEPCQGLDTQQTNRVVNIVDTICVCSLTSLIYVTHYQEQLPKCIDHLIELTEGKVSKMKTI